MRRICFLLLAGLLAVSCGQDDFNRLKINVDKALKRPVRCAELFVKADVIPLRVPDGIRVGQGETLLEVATDRFFLLNQERDAILVFDGAGECVTVLRSTEPVIDFSPYRDQVLTVLTAHTITEYAIQDGTVLASYPIQSDGFNLRCVARINDDSIYQLGDKDGKAYYFSYLISKRSFFPTKLPSSLNSTMEASETQSSRYFHDGDRCYSFLTQSGRIFGYDASSGFSWIDFIPDFGKAEIRLTNAQKTGNHTYYAFERNGESGVLVCNYGNGMYKAVRKTVEGSVFPLGVIYAGNNYYCCPAARLPEFLPDAPANGGEEHVIIRYALLASDLAVFRLSGRSKGKEQTAYEKSDAEDLLCGAAGRGPVRM